MIINTLKIIAVSLTLSVHSFAATEFFNSNFSDYTENLEEAQDQNKKGIFIFFHMEECPFCDKMKQTVLNKQNVIDYFQGNFLNYLEDVNSDIVLTDFKGEDVSGKVFAQKYNKVGATPVLAFFDLKGNKIATRTGFVGEEEFLLLAKYVVEGEYKNTSFRRYMRNMKKATL